MIDDWIGILYDGYEDEIYSEAELTAEEEKRAIGYMALKNYGSKLHPPIHRGCVCRIEPSE